MREHAGTRTPERTRNRPHRSSANTGSAHLSRAGLAAPLTASTVISLQRMVGNRAVTNVIQRVGPGPIPTDYSNLSVTSAGASLSDSGEFLGASAKEYADTQKSLRKAKKPATEIDVRFEMLRPKIDEAWNRLKLEQRGLTLKSVAGGGRPRVLGVFTAPEWFFKQPHNPFTPEQKDDIIERFTKLSNRLPDLLLVPGTIMWQEGSEDLTALHNTGFAVLNGNLLKLVNKEVNAGDTEGYYHRADDAATRSLPPKSEVEAAYARGHKGRTQQFDQPTGSVEGDSSHFDVGGLNVSLEICADHANIARAKSDVRVGQGPAAGVDLQILIAHGGQYSRGSDVTRPGGLFVFNDAGDAGSQGERKVWRNDKSTLGSAATQLGSGGPVGADAAGIEDFHVGADALRLPARTASARREQVKGTIPFAVAALRASRAVYLNWTTTFDQDIAKITAALGRGEERFENRSSVDNKARLQECEERRQAGFDVLRWIDDVIGRLDALATGLAAAPPTVTPADAARDGAAALKEVVEGNLTLPQSARDTKLTAYDHMRAVLADLLTAGL